MFLLYLMYLFVNFENIEILKKVISNYNINISNIGDNINNNIDNNIDNNELTNFVIIFDVYFENKIDINTQLKKIKEIKSQIIKENLKNIFFSIRIILYKLDSSYIGIINSLNNDFDIIIGFGGLNKINRFFLEKTNIDYLQDPHNSFYKVKLDFIHHFNSGLNHILCKLAKEKNIDFIFSLNFIKNNNNFYISKELGRVRQNIKFARKYNIDIVFNIINNEFNFKNKKQLFFISYILGLDTFQTKNMYISLENKLKNNIFKKSDKYIGKGIYIK